jgi:DNA-binding response OmpR family regulator
LTEKARGKSNLLVQLLSSDKVKTGFQKPMQSPMAKVSRLSNRKEVTRKRIVILSSDTTLGLSLSLFFENVYNVVSTSEGEVVENALGSNMIDLLIVDVGPFDTDLLNLVGSIRKKNSELPVIVMYVYQDKIRKLEDTLRSQVNMIFYKPVDLSQVSNEIRVLLAR